MAADNPLIAWSGETEIIAAAWNLDQGRTVTLRLCGEAFGRNRRPTVRDSRRHMNFETCVTRRACHRQAMRQEIPVLGDDIEQAQRCLRRDPG